MQKQGIRSISANKSTKSSQFPDRKWINWSQILAISSLGPNIKEGEITTAASMLRGFIIILTRNH